MGSSDSKPKDVTIRPARPEDAEGLAGVYNHYIEHSIATFEEQPVSRDEIWRRIEEVRAASLPWLVAEQRGAVVGYAYATGWRRRPAYRYSVEVTVYVAPEESGRGIGSRLYEVLLDELRVAGLHSAIGGISLPNDASVALHEKLGFEKVAHFEEVGFKFDRWIDVGYWQLIF
jgi:phosphinothricin acetyltransferase